MPELSRREPISEDGRQICEVHGSWGTLVADQCNGLVLEYLPNDDYDPDRPEEGGYDYIIRLDVDEWRTTYAGSEPDNCDILDLGYWTLDGNNLVYEPPEQDWREGMRKGWTDQPRFLPPRAAGTRY